MDNKVVPGSQQVDLVSATQPNRYGCPADTKGVDNYILAFNFYFS